MYIYSCKNKILQFCLKFQIPDKCDEQQFHVVKDLIILKSLSYSVSRCVMDIILKNINKSAIDILKTFSSRDDIEERRLRQLRECLDSDLPGFITFSNTMNKLITMIHSNMHFINRLQTLHKDFRVNITKHFQIRLCGLIQPLLPKGYIKYVFFYYRTALRSITEGVN